jgi:hypothetical protein
LQEAILRSGTSLSNTATSALDLNKSLISDNGVNCTLHLISTLTSIVGQKPQLEKSKKKVSIEQGDSEAISKLRDELETLKIESRTREKLLEMEIEHLKILNQEIRNTIPSYGLEVKSAKKGDLSELERYIAGLTLDGLMTSSLDPC